MREQLRQTALANRGVVAEHGVDALTVLALLVLLQHLLRVLVDRAVRQVAEHIQRSTVKPVTVSAPTPHATDSPLLARAQSNESIAVQIDLHRVE